MEEVNMDSQRELSFILRWGSVITILFHLAQKLEKRVRSDISREREESVGEVSLLPWVWGSKGVRILWGWIGRLKNKGSDDR